MDGILLIDKQSGKTSHDVVDAIRKQTGQRRVGHTGTLDPLATGLLVLCVGKATRLVEFMEGHDKEYEATLHLGRLTETDDREGALLQETPVSLTREDLESRLKALTGNLQQIPPRYAAIKKDGKKLYEYARAGEIVEVPARSVRVDRFDLLEWTPPTFRARISCSKGTYIRSLARDLGGSLDELRRTVSGPFRIENAHRENQDPVWLPLDAGIHHLPKVDIDPEEASLWSIGKDLSRSCDTDLVRIYQEDRFLGIGEKTATGIHPRKVFS
jgi:tRNA pseudouridine55 synthase